MEALNASKFTQKYNFEQKMVKESGKTASSLKLEIGFMDLGKRKLIPFPEEWLQSVKVPLKEELGLL